MMKGCVMKSMKKSVLFGLPLLCALSLSSAIAVGGMSAAAEEPAAAEAETYTLQDFPYHTGYSKFDWYTEKTNADYKMMIGPFDEEAADYGLTAFDGWNGPADQGGTGGNGNQLTSSEYSGLSVENWQWKFDTNTSVVIAVRSKIEGIIEINPSQATATLGGWIDAYNLIHSVHKYNSESQTIETISSYSQGKNVLTGESITQLSSSKPTDLDIEAFFTDADCSIQVSIGDIIYYEIGSLVAGRSFQNMLTVPVIATPLNTDNAGAYYGGLLDSYVASLTRSDYTDESWTLIEECVTAFKGGSYESAIDAKAAYDAAVAEIDAVSPDSKTYFEGRLDALVASLTQTDYEAQTWSTIQGYVTAFKEGTYATAEELKTAYETAVAAIEGTEPDSFTWLRADLLSKMNAYYNAQTESYYTPQDWATLKKAHDDYVANYESYASKEELQAYFDTQYAAMTAVKAYMQSFTYVDLPKAVNENDFGWISGAVADVTMYTGSVQHDTLVAFDDFTSTSSADTLKNSALQEEYPGAYAQNWKWYVGMNIGVTVAYRANQDCSLVIDAREGEDVELGDSGWTEVCTLNVYIVRDGETKLVSTTPMNDSATDEAFFGTWYLKEGDILYIEFISNATDARNTESPFVLEATLDATKFDEDAYAEQNHDLPAEVLARIEEKLADLQEYLGTLNEEDYSATNWLLLSDYVAQFEADCEMEVATVEDVDALYNETLAAMQAVPTLAEAEAQLKETLDQYVEELRAEYNALIEQYRYSDEAKAALDAALEEGIQNINNASSAAAGNTAKSRALTALRAVEGSPKGLGTGAVIGIVAACVVVAAGAVTAGVLIGKKKKAKKDGE